MSKKELTYTEFIVELVYKHPKKAKKLLKSMQAKADRQFKAFDELIKLSNEQ
jgi:hypothetical protein